MATLSELLGAHDYTDLRLRVRMATVLAAEVVRSENVAVTNHANRLLWAKRVYEDPFTMGDSMFWAVLAQNSGFTYNQIINASDAAVQTAVNNAVDVFSTPTP